MSRRLIWPGVLLLCTLAGCELLWSISGLWLKTCPYTTLSIFGVTFFSVSLILLRSGRSLFGSSTALHAIYSGLVLINAFWLLHSIADDTVFSRGGLFGQTSQRASWDNPLLPEEKQWFLHRQPYHSWIFEPHKVLQSIQQLEKP